MSPFLHQTSKFRSGFIALIGRPNVGKSTLINKLVGKKVSITSPVSQTTRSKLRAILTTPKAQLVFVDTPGIHKPHHLLGQSLVKRARSTIGEVDIILLLFEANHLPGKGDHFIVNLLRNQNKPIIVALNKCDQITRKEFHKTEDAYRELIEQVKWPIHFCSALRGEGCNELIELLSSLLPIGPFLYPPRMVSDQPEKLILEELVREQVLHLTREEVPHSVAVKIERIEEVSSTKKASVETSYTAILATILVERNSQKGILIGKEGLMLKKIGKGARLQMQKLIEGKIYLELFVKVVPNWRMKAERLKELGYEVN